MTTHLQLAAVLMASACTMQAGAQTMYKCGTTYSQTPCGAGQKEIEVKVDDPCDSEANKYSSACIMRPYKPHQPTAAEKKQALALDKLEKQREQDAARRAEESRVSDNKAAGKVMQDALDKWQRKAAVIPDTPPSTATIEKSKSLCTKAVIDQMKDPESAKVTDIQRVGAQEVELAGGTWAVRIVYRMNVNAKNSYGGYVGKTPWKCDFLQGEKELKGAYPLQ